MFVYCSMKYRYIYCNMKYRYIYLYAAQVITAEASSWAKFGEKYNFRVNDIVMCRYAVIAAR